MKIVVFEAEPREAPVFEALRDQHELVRVDSPLRSENVAQHADADVVSTFIYSELDSGVLEKLPSLKLIATRSTGFDHIDTDYCTARGDLIDTRALIQALTSGKVAAAGLDVLPDEPLIREEAGSSARSSATSTTCGTS